MMWQNFWVRLVSLLFLAGIHCFSGKSLSTGEDSRVADGECDVTKGEECQESDHGELPP